MVRAVIFDFDGVITDSEILHFRCFNEVLAQYHIDITTKDYYKNYLGLSDRELFEQLVGKDLLKLDAEGIEDLVKQKNRIFEKLIKTEGEIIEGVRDFIGKLKQESIPMAICSGSLLTEIELILEQSNLRSYFEVIVSANHVKKGKPDPEGFLLALQKLNEKTSEAILPGQCVAIEDSHWGLQAANGAGMHTVAITNSYEAEQLAGAEKIVANFGELSISELHKLCTQ